jgi:hypothetical protein
MEIFGGADRIHRRVDASCRSRRQSALMLRLGVLVALLCCACSEPNPKSCLDGTCTDPAFPFCDVDGAVHGVAGECIAVSCIAGELAACRTDQAIECNSTGTNYELVECLRGCDRAAHGCKECNDSTECTTATPYCDTTSYSCRQCRIDDECASTVCNDSSGQCVSPSEIVYAAPTGPPSAPCTQAEPCSFTQAVSVASTNPARSIIRMTPGDYVGAIAVSAGKFSIVGTGATLSAGDANGHSILRGSDVTVRGLKFLLASGSLYCGWGRVNTSALGGRLTLDRVTLVPANQNTLQTQGCVLTGTQVRVEPIDANLPIFRDDSEVALDRSTFRSSLGGYVLLMGSRVILSITNSIFDNTLIDFDPRDQTGSTSRVVFAFNTVVRTGPVAISRENPAATGNTGTFLSFIENNIFVVGSGADAVLCPGCSLSNNVINRQATALAASNVIADPGLLDPAGHDFHLKADSPAVDSASASPGIGTDHDYDGHARPAGARADVGALERLAQ